MGMSDVEELIDLQTVQQDDRLIVRNMLDRMVSDLKTLRINHSHPSIPYKKQINKIIREVLYLRASLEADQQI